MKVTIEEIHNRAHRYDFPEDMNSRGKQLRSSEIWTETEFTKNEMFNLLNKVMFGCVDGLVRKDTPYPTNRIVMSLEEIVMSLTARPGVYPNNIVFGLCYLLQDVLVDPSEPDSKQEAA